MVAARRKPARSILQTRGADRDDSVKRSGRIHFGPSGVAAGSDEHAASGEAILDHVRMWRWVARRMSAGRCGGATVEDFGTQIDSHLHPLMDVRAGATAN